MNFEKKKTIPEKIVNESYWLDEYDAPNERGSLRTLHNRIGAESPVFTCHTWSFVCARIRIYHGSWSRPRASHTRGIPPFSHYAPSSSHRRPTDRPFFANGVWHVFFHALPPPTSTINLVCAPARLTIRLTTYVLRCMTCFLYDFSSLTPCSLSTFYFTSQAAYRLPRRGRGIRTREKTEHAIVKRIDKEPVCVCVCGKTASLINRHVQPWDLTTNLLFENTTKSPLAGEEWNFIGPIGV